MSFPKKGWLWLRHSTCDATGQSDQEVNLYLIELGTRDKAMFELDSSLPSPLLVHAHESMYSSLEVPSLRLKDRGRVLGSRGIQKTCVACAMQTVNITGSSFTQLIKL